MTMTNILVDPCHCLQVLTFFDDSRGSAPYLLPTQRIRETSDGHPLWFADCCRSERWARLAFASLFQVHQTAVVMGRYVHARVNSAREPPGNQPSRGTSACISSHPPQWVLVTPPPPPCSSGILNVVDLTSMLIIGSTLDMCYFVPLAVPTLSQIWCSGV